MRLYDFSCAGCGLAFEDLVTTPEEARCPSCGSQQVERQLSRFSVGGRANAEAPCAAMTGGVPMCGAGGCGGGGCGLSN